METENLRLCAMPPNFPGVIEEKCCKCGAACFHPPETTPPDAKPICGKCFAVIAENEGAELIPSKEARERGFRPIRIEPKPKFAS
jgi:hypothetical protein